MRAGIVPLTVIVGQVMTSVYVADVPKQPFVSVALTTIGNEPVCVGVPERCPVEEFSVRPVGSVLDVDHVAVPRTPQAVNVWSNEFPSVAVVTPGSSR